MENNRFSINEIHICPLEILPNKNIGFDITTYPTRYCVLDNDNNIAVDIELKVQYDYIVTTSFLHVISTNLEKIGTDKRVAVRPYKSLLINNDILEKSKAIIKELELGKSFVDGNDVFNNEDYLKYIEHLNKKQQIKEKIKRKIFDK